MTDITNMCGLLRNYFTDKEHIFSGTYTIVDKSLNIDFIKSDQYFRITGSVFNNGVYCNNPDDLKRLRDETFSGTIWAMSVPADFIELCDDAERFKEKISEISGNFSGYVSETWGGYTYTLPTSAPAFIQDWQYRIKQGMNKYRRLREI